MDALITKIASEAGVAICILLVGYWPVTKLYLMEREERRELQKSLFDIAPKNVEAIKELASLIREELRNG
jgi:hypothetical protein